MKKIIALTFSLLLAFSLTACGNAMDNTESMGQSVVSKTESVIDDASSTISKAMEQMASITANKAKEIALKHAELQESQVSDVEVDLEREDGKLFYEVKFNSANTEYEYDIDADSGEVITHNKEND